MDEAKRTTIARVTLSQEARVILEPVGHWRLVQLVLPESPLVYIVLDKSPKTIGRDRTYKMPELAGGQTISFRLAPGQFMVGAVEQGSASIAIIEQWMGG